VWIKSVLIVAASGLPPLLGICCLAQSQEAKSAYSVVAPLAQYRMMSPSEEAALARSAAPASISGDAEVLVLGDHGYETAIKGKNGFVCLVERSWGAGFEDAEFWNPKLRGPLCFNPAGARSVLPGYLERSQWVLAGKSKGEMIARTQKEVADKHFVMPEAGAMAYMLSKQGYLSDTGGHWHPHLMFFLAHTDAAAWGANLDGSPVQAGKDDSDPVTTFFILVARWSDGTPSDAPTH
jgi:hypothetical protein